MGCTFPQYLYKFLLVTHLCRWVTVPDAGGPLCWPGSLKNGKLYPKPGTSTSIAVLKTTLRAWVVSNFLKFVSGVFDKSIRNYKRFFSFFRAFQQVLSRAKCEVFLTQNVLMSLFKTSFKRVLHSVNICVP